MSYDPSRVDRGWHATSGCDACHDKEAMVRRYFSFDEAYYHAYYVDPRTSAMNPDELRRLCDFVCAYVRYLEQPLKQVLDIGCGLGFWRNHLRSHFPQAQYIGVENSDYLCERYGWDKGSVVDYRSDDAFDLVICNDVLQYLASAQATSAIANLALLCRGVLYFGALTEEDWATNCDRDRTDGNAHLRPARWYRKRLAMGFANVGGGLFVSHRSPTVLYELEKL